MATISADGFINDLAVNNIASSSQLATGLLGPLMRAMGHLLYALAAASTTPPSVTPEELLDEVRSAETHLDSTITLADNVLSIAAYDRINILRAHTRLTATLWETWPEPDRPRCLLALINSYMSLATFLDRELAGIPDHQSNPGSSL